ncbi:MAG TPA: low specificity L-threonine aldolase [Gemmatimonadales bacterium]|jgi:threonine aldolase
MSARRQFASDNYAGVHPEVLQAIAETNTGHATSYGDDPYTRQAIALFRRHLGEQARAWLLFNGTAANVLGLSAVTRPHHAVICAEAAHISVDECGATERFTGCKLLTVPTRDGKLRPADVLGRLQGIGDQHRVQPRVVSITQATEMGTVYSPEEVRALAETAHAHGLLLHMDGARIANAAVTLGGEFSHFTSEAGVDLLSFGGTKNGLMAAEALVFLNGLDPAEMPFIRKQGMQLASKMRFLAVQFIALLGTDLWRRNAGQANLMARLLADRIADVSGITITQPVEANGVFARVAPAHIAALQEHAFFYVWNADTSEVRWMTAWDTTEEDVERFATAIRAIVR